MTPVSITFKIEKADKTGRYVAGWLSVVEKDGKVVEDTQGDRISMEELRKGVHKYMRGSRVIKKQHAGGQIGEMVEVVMIDDDFAKAHGITHTKRGAWGTAEITDADVRKSVVAGDVTGWSMGGAGKRKPIAKSDSRARRLANLKAARRAPAQSGARQRFREAAALYRGAQKREPVKKASGFFARFL
jgi:hypothetical protein